MALLSQVSLLQEAKKTSESVQWNSGFQLKTKCLHLTQHLTPPEPQDFVCSGSILKRIYNEVDKWE